MPLLLPAWVENAGRALLLTALAPLSVLSVDAIFFFDRPPAVHTALALTLAYGVRLVTATMVFLVLSSVVDALLAGAAVVSRNEPDAGPVRLHARNGTPFTALALVTAVLLL